MENFAPAAIAASRLTSRVWWPGCSRWACRVSPSPPYWRKRTRKPFRSATRQRAESEWAIEYWSWEISGSRSIAERNGNRRVLHRRKTASEISSFKMPLPYNYTTHRGISSAQTERGEPMLRCGESEIRNGRFGARSATGTTWLERPLFSSK